MHRVNRLSPRRQQASSQQASKQTPDKFAGLEARIRQVAEEGSRDTFEGLIKTYKTKAIQAQSIERYLWAVLQERNDDWRYGLSTAEQNYPDFHRLLHSSWVSDSDKVMLCWFVIRELLDKDLFLKRGKKTDPLYVTDWNLDVSKDIFSEMMRLLSEKPEALRFSPKRLYPKLSNNDMPMINSIIMDLLDLRVIYGRMEFALHAQKELRKMLEHYLSQSPGKEAKLGPRYLLIKWSDTEPEQRLRELQALEKDYHLKPEIAPFVHLISKDIAEIDSRTAYLMLDEYTKHGQSNSPYYATWKSNRNILLKASLDMALASKVVLLPSNKQKLRFALRFVESLDIEVYRVPYLITNDYNWQPSKHNKPIYTQTHPCPSNERWSREWIEIELPQQEPGYYYVRIKPKLHPLASNKSEKLSAEKHYHLTELYALSESLILDKVYQSGIRLLNAHTGAPQGDLPLRLTNSKGEGKDRVNKHQDYKTDEQGFAFLNQGDKANYLQVLLEQDPIFSQLDQAYVYTRELGLKNREHFMLGADRTGYLPGQTVYLYGYLINQSIHPEETKTLSNKRAILRVRSDRGKDLKVDSIKTDKYGRFTYQYTIPQNTEEGSIWFIVEDMQGKKESLGQKLIGVAKHRFTLSEMVLTTPKHQHLIWGDTLELKAKLRTFSGTMLTNTPISLELYVRRRYFGLSEFDGESHREIIELTTDSLGELNYRLPLRYLRDPQTLNDTKSELHSHDNYEITLSTATANGEVHSEKVFVSLINPKNNQLSCKVAPLIERKRLGQGFSITSSPAKKANISYSIEREGRSLQEGQCKNGETIQIGDWIREAEVGLYTIKYSTEVKGQTSHGQTDFRLYDLDLPLPKLADSSLYILERDTTFRHSAPPRELHFATSIPDSYVFYTIDSDDGVLGRGMLRPKAGSLQAIPFTAPSDTLERIRLSVYSVWRGKHYEAQQIYSREPADKRLELRWTSWRDRIRAGSRERWTLQVLHQGKPVRAALASWMGDASLDDVAYDLSKHLEQKIERFSGLTSARKEIFDTRLGHLSGYPTYLYLKGLDLRTLIQDIEMGDELVNIPEYLKPNPYIEKLIQPETYRGRIHRTGVTDKAPRTLPYAPPVYLHRLMETNAQGEVSWEFDVPDITTRWRVDVLAHTKDFKTAHEIKYLESYRELQVKPQLPRFLRLGDQLGISTEIRNNSDTTLEGKAYIELFNPKTKELLHKGELSFTLTPSKHQTLTFDLPISKDFAPLDNVGLRLYAETPSFTDGEEHLLPIIPTTTLKGSSR